MKKLIVGSTLATLLALTACSDQSPTEASGKGTSTSPLPKMLINIDIPESFKGMKFEAGGKCAVDYVNKPEKSQTTTISKKDGMNVEGWALDDKQGKVPPVLALQLATPDGKYFYSMLNRHAGREDLAKLFGKSEFAKAGYSAKIDIGNLPVGNYDMLIILKEETRNLVCSTYRKLVVTE